MTARGQAEPVPGFLVTWARATDIGHVRSLNEDSLLSEPPIFAVADGMGGHEAGEVASALAIQEFTDLARSCRSSPELDTADEAPAGSVLTIEDLGAALQRARASIEGLGTGGPLSAGTTVALVATMAVDGAPYWVVMNLGDSRVYRMGPEGLEQISVDHSVVQDLVDRGEITPAQARVHPYRNMITRALGAGPVSEPDYWLIPAEKGDRMLICSDGLTGEVTDDVLEDVLESCTDLQAAADELVTRALDAGGHDNVTVVLVEATDVQEAPEPGPTVSPEADAGNPAPTDQADTEDTRPRTRHEGRDE